MERTQLKLLRLCKYPTELPVLPGGPPETANAEEKRESTIKGGIDSEGAEGCGEPNREQGIRAFGPLRKVDLATHKLHVVLGEGAERIEGGLCCSEITGGRDPCNVRAGRSRCAMTPSAILGCGPCHHVAMRAACK